MKTFYKKIAKPIIHEAFYLYSNEDVYKEYSIIDKEMMHENIMYHFKHSLNELLDLECLPILIEHAKKIKENGFFKLETLEYDSYSTKGLFLIDSYIYKDNTHMFTMPMEVTNYLLNITIDEIYHESQLFKKCIFGMLEIYGVLTHDEIYAIYKTIRPSVFKGVEIPKIEDILFLRDELLLKGYRIYEDGMTHPLIDILDLDIDVYIPKKLYDLNTYLSFSQIAYIDHIYDYYNDKQYKRYMLFEAKDNINKKIQNIRINQLIKSGHKDMLNWPLWSLGGYSISNMDSLVTNLPN